MYFRDLTPYKYLVEEEAKNIGWLDGRKKFMKGEVTEEFLDKLWAYYRYPIRVCRGFHECDFCSSHTQDGPARIEHRGIQRDTGYYELRVFGKDGTIYAAPGLIFHYIIEHGYKPPQEFIDAVMEGDTPYSEQYFSKINKMYHDQFWWEEDRTLLKGKQKKGRPITQAKPKEEKTTLKGKWKNAVNNFMLHRKR